MRQRRFAEAHQRATELAAEGRPHVFVRAVQIDAAQQLGLRYDADALPDLCTNLRGRGYAAWADQLEAAAGSRSTQR